MNEYMKKLLKLFRKSLGISSKDFDIQRYEKEFQEWLSKYTARGELYLKWLKEEGYIKQLSPKVAEIGKGEYDTLTKNQNTILISPYISENQQSLNNKVITSDFTVFNGIPLYIGKKPFDIVKDVERFMTQNPYAIEDLINWPQLYNYGERDITIGMYGNIFDNDWQEKVKQLSMIKERLFNEFFIEEMISDDNYCYVLSTKRNNK